jgi:hypothetical protein
MNDCVVIEGVLSDYKVPFASLNKARHNLRQISCCNLDDWN